MLRSRIPSMSPWRWGIVLLVLVAVPLRIHGLGRSLWLDEAWVANSLLEPDLASVFYYETWLQTTPPVFLLLERLVLQILPPANWAFRLLPYLCGLLGVGAMACLALKLLRAPMAFLVLLLFVFAPGHVILSQMVKPYTSDVLVSIVLMLCALAHLRDRSTGLLLAAVGVFVVLAGFSYNAVLFMPALLYGALFAPPAPAARLPVWRVRWTHCLAVMLAVAVTAAINYAVFIEPNLDRNIAGGGPDAGLDAWSARLLAKSVTLIRLFKHFFFSFGEPWSGVWLDLLMVGAALVALIGLCHLLARGGKGRPCNLDRAAVLALPVAGAFVLDLAGYYPLISPRLNIFLLPAALVLFGIGVQALVVRGRLLFARSPMVRWSLRSPRPYAAIGIGLAAVFVLRVAVGGPAPFFTWAAETDEDAEAAVSYLAAVAGPGDVLYVDTSMLEPLRWYARFTPIDVARVVQGTIAWPCCPRDMILDRRAPPERNLPPEIDRILAGGVGDTLWMLYTGRPYHWEFAGANYPDRFDEVLRERGCRNVDNPRFEGVRLIGYQCPPEAGRNRSIGQAEGAPASGRPQ